MRKLQTIATFAFVAAFSVLRVAADESVPKGETVLEQYIEATGGKAAYEKIHTEITGGSFELTGKGIRGSLNGYKAAPNKSYMAVNIPGVGMIEDGSNGEIAWNRSALQGPRIKDGDEKATALREATFNTPLYWRKLYKSVETAGVENVGDQPCYKVVLTPNEGKPETHYYDQKSHLLIKVSMNLTTPMGEIPVENKLGDYRKDGAILTPHRLEQSAMGQEILITIDSVKWNEEIPKSRFDVPADVQALQPKTTK